MTTQAVVKYRLPAALAVSFTLAIVGTVSGQDAEPELEEVALEALRLLPAADEMVRVVEAHDVAVVHRHQSYEAGLAETLAEARAILETLSMIQAAAEEGGDYPDWDAFGIDPWNDPPVRRLAVLRSELANVRASLNDMRRITEWVVEAYEIWQGITPRTSEAEDLVHEIEALRELSDPLPEPTNLLSHAVAILGEVDVDVLLWDGLGELPENGLRGLQDQAAAAYDECRVWEEGVVRSPDYCGLRSVLRRRFGRLNNALRALEGTWGSRRAELEDLARHEARERARQARQAERQQIAGRANALIPEIQRLRQAVQDQYPQPLPVRSAALINEFLRELEQLEAAVGEVMRQTAADWSRASNEDLGALVEDLEGEVRERREDWERRQAWRRGWRRIVPTMAELEATVAALQQEVESTYPETSGTGAVGDLLEDTHSLLRQVQRDRTSAERNAESFSPNPPRLDATLREREAVLADLQRRWNGIRNAVVEMERLAVELEELAAEAEELARGMEEEYPVRVAGMGPSRGRTIQNLIEEVDELASEAREVAGRVTETAQVGALTAASGGIGRFVREKQERLADIQQRWNSVLADRDEARVIARTAESFSRYFEHLRQEIPDAFPEPGETVEHLVARIEEADSAATATRNLAENLVGTGEGMPALERRFEAARQARLEIVAESEELFGGKDSATTVLSGAHALIGQARSFQAQPKAREFGLVAPAASIIQRGTPLVQAARQFLRTGETLAAVETAARDLEQLGNELNQLRASCGC